MITWTMHLDADNAAFVDHEATELARILRHAADRIESDGPDVVPLLDVNGNRVGTLTREVAR